MKKGVEWMEKEGSIDEKRGGMDGKRGVDWWKKRGEKMDRKGEVDWMNGYKRRMNPLHEIFMFTQP